MPSRVSCCHRRARLPARVLEAPKIVALSRRRQNTGPHRARDAHVRAEQGGNRDRADIKHQTKRTDRSPTSWATLQTTIM
eukprot:3014611-Prymnesium_polylepis.1